jgi:hypothetical protein
MAVTFVASVSAAQGVNGGTTAAIDTTGATLIVVAVSSYVAGPFPVVTDSKGNTYTGLTVRSYISVFQQFHYVLAPTVGAGHTITVTGTGIYNSVVAYAFGGVASYQTESSAQSSASPLAPGSVTPSANGALIVTSLNSETVATDTIPTGFTGGIQVTYVGGSSMQTSTAYLIQPTAAAINPSWSWAGGTHNAIAAVAVFAAAPASAARVDAYVWGPL